MYENYQQKPTLVKTDVFDTVLISYRRVKPEQL